MTIFTIGSGMKSAQQFFELLQKAGVTKVIDIRLNNTSQLAGFSKMNDLAYFLKVIAGIGYEHLTEFSPTDDLVDGYRGKKYTWEEFSAAFRKLLAERAPLQKYDSSFFDHACLLCAEPKAAKCHRSLVTEYIAKTYPDVKIVHL